MQDIHAPSPEFTRFLEWQTRTELRRRESFERPPTRLLRVARLTRVAVLIFVSLFVGAGVVFAVERIQDSRELEVLLQYNNLLVELSERRVEGAREVAETERSRYEQGLTTPGGVLEAERRVAEREHHRDHLQLDRRELLAARRTVDSRLSAPLVGARDFVSEHLRISKLYGMRAVELWDQDEQMAQHRFESGLTTQTTLDRARRDAGKARAEVERLDERLALRADFLLGRIDAETCERQDFVGDAERRRRALTEDAELVRRELLSAEAMEAAGRGSGLVAPLRAQLDGIEVELRLVDLELELLR